MSASDAVSVFLRLGLDSRTAESTARAGKVGPALLSLAREAGVAETGCEKSVGVLLLQAATKLAPSGLHYSHRTDLLDLITTRRIRSVAAVDAACDYLRRGSSTAAGQQYDRREMEAVAGVGVEYTDSAVLAVIVEVLDSHSASLHSERYRAANRLLGSVTARLPWSDGRRVKEAFDSEVERRLGPKTEEDTAPPPTKKKQPATANGAAATNKTAVALDAPASTTAPAQSASSPPASSEPASLSSPSPTFLSLPVMSDPAALSSFLDNIDGREIAAARNTAEQLRRHEAVVPRGQVRSRFPPEPNGYLHLGHAKAMNFNFGLAALTGGQCFMRFDDTNPEAEKLDYIEQILNNLQWLGHQPARITYSSDYFPQLYELAVQLIKSGHAYVDHQTAAEIKASRDYKEGSKAASPWRHRPIEESLRLFDDMRRGRFEEGAATLRMKGDLSHPNPQMWDLVAYRIKYAEHPHVGDRWCIYPSYDYTHWSAQLSTSHTAAARHKHTGGTQPWRSQLCLSRTWPAW